MSSTKVKFSLKAKLILSTTTILIVVFAILGMLVFWGLSNLSNTFLVMNAGRAEEVKKELKNFSDQSTERIKERYSKKLEQKGLALVKKDSGSLYTPFMDNSFMQIRDFLKNSFSDDKEVVHASFFVLESGQIKGWQLLNNEYPEGLDLPFEYSQKEKAFKGTYKGKKKVSITDEAVNELIQVTKPSTFFRTELNAEGSLVGYIDAIVPIYDGMLSTNPLQALKKIKTDGGVVAYLRYRLSLDEMNKAINEEKKSFESALSKLEQGNTDSAKKTKMVGGEMLEKVLRYMGISAGGLIAISVLVIFIFSKKITSPILKLIEIARLISQGNYKVKVDIVTNDEVGILASTFKDMAAAIVKRDDELAELNRGLEDQVKERTKQLNEEMKKVRNLLDSMQQSVFSIEANGNIVEPVSKFSEQIFKQEIASKNMMDVIFNGLDPKSEQMVAFNTAMIAVFDEGDMQWMLMEDNFPARIVKGSGDDLQVLKISYTPIWNNEGLLKQIMLVVQDVTTIEKLELQIALERKSSAEKNEILQELSACDVESIQTYINSTYTLLEQSIELMNDPEIFMQNRAELFRHLHTIKGNSRVYGFMKLSAQIHHLEGEVATFRDKEDAIVTHEELSDMQKQLAEFIGLFQKYTFFSESILRIDNQYKGNTLQQLHTDLLAGKLDFVKLQKSALAIKATGTDVAVNSVNALLANFSNKVALNQLQLYSKSSFVQSNLFYGFDRDFSNLGAWYKSITKNDKNAKIHLSVQYLVEDTKSASLVLYYIVLNEIVLSGNLKFLIEEFKKNQVDWNFLCTKFYCLRSLDLPTEFFNGLEEFLKEQYKDLDGLNIEVETMKDLFKATLTALTSKDTENSIKYICEECELPAIMKKLNQKLYQLFIGHDYAFVFMHIEFLSSYVSRAARKPSAAVVYQESINRLRFFADGQNNVELKTLIEGLSYVPLKASLDIYYSLVDELSAKLNKKINFSIVGDNVFLNKKSAENFKNALTHLVRNSLDHGIEEEELRLKWGKSKSGNIQLSLEQGPQAIKVVLSDDGKGIDSDLLRTKLVEKKIYDLDKVKKLSDQEVKESIFLPEFSTKDEVSEISGRGVGMDAVKKIIEEMGGRIELRSTAKVGTEFVMLIPMSEKNS